MNKEPMVFADGMNIYQPHEKTKTFLFGNASFNVKKFKEFLDKNVDGKGYVKVKFPISSKTNQPYAILDTFKAQPKAEAYTEFNAEEIGF